MASRKTQKSPGGAPDWMVTYGDMMSLLLCFFVLLVAMSKIKEEEKFQLVMESIREAFGYRGGVGAVPTDAAPTVSLLKRLETIVVPKKLKKRGDADDEGIEGRVFRVTQVREGIHVNIGGRVSFERFSAQLKPEGEALIRQLAENIRGHRTKVEIRGHATREPLPPESPYRDSVDLSYARAKAVANVFTAGDGLNPGIDPGRIRVTACGSSEPLLRQAYDEQRRAANRRVEVIVNEALVSDYEGEGLGSQE